MVIRILRLVLALIFLAQPIWAFVPGEIDSTFNPPVLELRPHSYTEPFYAGVYPDGRLIIAGPFTKADGHDRLGLARLHADGRLDLSWAPPRIGYAIDGAVLLRNGQVIVQPLATNTQPALRINEDGSIDPTFAAGDLRGRYGVVFFELPDDRLAVNRRGDDGVFVLSLLKSNGEPDLSFLPVPSTDIIRVSPRGRILVYSPAENAARILDATGAPTMPSFSGFPAALDVEGYPLMVALSAQWPYVRVATALHRYHPDGEIDFQYRSRGLPRAGFLPGARAGLGSPLPVVPDSFGGFFYVSGSSFSETNIFLSHVDATGKAQIVSSNPPSEHFVSQSPDKLVFVTRNNADQQLVRVHTGMLKGAPPAILSQPLEASGIFGSFTRLTVHVEGEDLNYQWVHNGTNVPDRNTRDLVRPVTFATAGAYQLIASNAYGSATSAPIRFAVDIVRAGERDPTFQPHLRYDVKVIAPQPDGKIIIGGAFEGVQRLLANGARDTNFQTGTLTFPVSAVRVAPDGAIFVSGDGLGITKLLPSGQLDSTFTSAVSGRVDDLAFRRDGKILVAGRLTHGGSQGGLARMNPNGSLDGNSFYAQPILNVAKGRLTKSGQLLEIRASTVLLHPQNWQASQSLVFTRGFFLYDINRTYPGSVTDVLSRDDGSFLVSGLFAYPIGGIAKLLPNGEIDPTFVASALMDLSWTKTASALAEGRDGKIIVAGGLFYSAPSPVGVYRLQTNGELDVKFKPAEGVFHALAVETSGDILAAGQGTNRLIRLFGNDAGERLNYPHPESRHYKTEVLSINGAEYSLQFSSRAEGPWTIVATAVGSGGKIILEDERDRGVVGAFYRLRVKVP